MTLARWLSEQDLTEQMRQASREGTPPSQFFESTPYQILRLLYRDAPGPELDLVSKLATDNEQRAADKRQPLLPPWCLKSVPYERKR